MQQFVLPGWRIECDRERTIAAHEKLTGGPELCACAHCRNWVLSHSRIIPAEVQEFLNQLGVPLDHECEVYHNGKLETGTHFYAGWYHFVGRVLYGEKEDSAHLTFGNFSLFFHSSPALLPDVFDGQAVVQIEFEVVTPWLSDIPEPP